MREIVGDSIEELKRSKFRPVLRRIHLLALALVEAEIVTAEADGRAPRVEKFGNDYEPTEYCAILSLKTYRKRVSQYLLCESSTTLEPGVAAFLFGEYAATTPAPTKNARAA